MTWADGIIAIRGARTLLLATVLVVPACDSSQLQGIDDGRQAQADGQVPADVIAWGCERAIPSSVRTLDPRWRDEATMVGDFGFNVTAEDYTAWRPHRRADLQFKLPVTIDGRIPATVWVPREEWDHVSLILADVPRRGPGTSYRVEDGHRAIRFEPCTDRQWSAWTAGLALTAPREIDLMVEVSGGPQPVRVTLGPWATHTIDP